jgi:putative ABC transport system permease protein
MSDGRGAFSGVTVRLESPAAFQKLKDALTSNPALAVDVHKEREFYASRSASISKVINIVAYVVGGIMAIGAIFGALNTMYSAVSERSREVATLRAIGFGSGAVVTSFVAEALFIAFLGGLLGCVAVLPINGLTTGTMNWQTFSHLAFAFRVTPTLLALGVAFALAMGLVGGVPPAIRAARLPVAAALRDL